MGIFLYLSLQSDKCPAEHHGLEPFDPITNASETIPLFQVNKNSGWNLTPSLIIFCISGKLKKTTFSISFGSILKGPLCDILYTEALAFLKTFALHAGYSKFSLEINFTFPETPSSSRISLSAAFWLSSFGST